MIGYSEKCRALVAKGKHKISNEEVAIKMIPKKGMANTEKDRLRQLIKMYRCVTH